MLSSRVSAQIVVPLTLVAGLAVLLAIVPLPGSLSVLSTRWLGSVGARVPGVELISEVGLVLLAAATAAALAHAWWRDSGKRPRVVVAGAGVVLAYLLSEGGKIVFAQPRPCSIWPISGECPPPGDWSLPSNHATLAFGAAAVIALVVRRSWITWSAIALAAVVALGRVAQGVHYVHDVALGAVLGVTVPVLAVLVVEVVRDARGRTAERRG